MGLTDLFADIYSALSFTEVYAEAPEVEEKEEEGGESKPEEGKEEGDESEGANGEEKEGGDEEEGGDEGKDEAGEEEEEEEEEEPEDPKPKLEEGTYLKSVCIRVTSLQFPTYMHCSPFTVVIQSAHASII